MPAISQEDWWTMHNAVKPGGTLDQVSAALEELRLMYEKERTNPIPLGNH